MVWEVTVESCVVDAITGVPVVSSTSCFRTSGQHFILPAVLHDGSYLSSCVSESMSCWGTLWPSAEAILVSDKWGCKCVVLRVFSNLHK